MPDSLMTSDPERAVEVLANGGLVGLPTETVYGLGADATNRSAVERIFEVKGRPAGHPLIVHLGPSASLDGWVADDYPHPEVIERLASAFWPGPLTLIVPAGDRALSAVTGSRPTVGLRRPGHPVAAAVLDRFGGAVAAPSANRFGRVSPTTAEDVIADLGARLRPGVDVVVDGGSATVGIESTIVDLATGTPQILRYGAITESDLAAVIGITLDGPSGPSRASGMLPSHYAPSTAIIAVATTADAEQQHEERTRQGQRCRVLDRTDDLETAARHLYSDFRRADLDQLDALIVVLPDDDGLGAALRDRITKAANGSQPTSRSG